MEKKFKANELRKNGQFEEALVIYNELRSDDNDPYIIAGTLHCLRKISRFTEALPICEIVENKHLDSDWCKNEAIWTLIQGVLEKLEDDANVSDVCNIADRIISLEPKDSFIKWRILRRILKSAKQKNKWQIILNRIDYVNPEELSNIPIKDDKGHEWWSEQSTWYNYKIRALLETGNKKDAIALASRVMGLFPKQERFFKRLIALAEYKLSNLHEAETIYSNLINVPRPDWWILQEYAVVLKQLENYDLALETFCKAAISHKRLESLVSLFQEMADLLDIIGNIEQAYYHYMLCKLIRESHNWSIPQPIIDFLSSNKDTTDSKIDFNTLLSSCNSFWYKTLGITKPLQSSTYKKRRPKKELEGKLLLGNLDKPFCFIKDDNDNKYFCFKSDLPDRLRNGVEVLFDAIPSFDRKKKQDSWRAVNIRKK